MKDPYKFEPHKFKGRICNYEYCILCGLVALRNDFSQWSIKMGCNSEDHPRYQEMRKGGSINATRS